MFRIRMLLVVVCLTMLASTANAGWIPDGTPVCNAGGQEFRSLVTVDGQGGVIIVWNYVPNPGAHQQVYGQRISSYGNAIWTIGGIELTSTAYHSGVYNIASDGYGGVYIPYVQPSNGYYVAYLLRITEDGEPVAGWVPGGLPLVSGINSPPNDIKSDGNHGIFITWEAGSGEDADVFVQRVTPAGSIAPGWPSGGLQITTLNGFQGGSHLAPDGIGGVYVVWTDKRDGNTRIYAQHVNANANLSWVENGIPISSISSNQSGGFPVISGGALYVSWVDDRDPPYGQRVVQRISSSGNVSPGWPSSGKSLGNIPIWVGYGSWGEIIADGQGGVLISWVSPRTLSGVGYSDVWVQRIQVDGNFVSGWESFPILTNFELCSLPQLVSDGQGGAAVTYTKADQVTGESDIYIQHISGNGEFGPSSSISSATGNQYEIQMTGTDPDHLVVVWQDERNGTNGDIYAQRVRISDGYVADQTPRPVVLVHGICSDGHMWDDFASTLTQNGFTVRGISFVDNEARPEQQAGWLEDYLKSNFPNQDVDVVAHSMGGLVCREYISRQASSNLHNQIRTLITLGTPHHGSEMARVALDVVGFLRNPAASYALQTFVCQTRARGLRDMVPASKFLNRLNYGADKSRWDKNEITTSRDPIAGEYLPANGPVYYTFAGSGGLCSDIDAITDWAVWVNPNYPNDGAVGYKSAKLYASGTHSFSDFQGSVNIGTQLAHTAGSNNPFCTPGYTESSQLTQVIMDILYGNPPADPTFLVQQMAEGVTEDTLENFVRFPTLSGSVLASSVQEVPITLPATSSFRILLGANGAQLNLRRPSGVLITSADTATVTGLQYFQVDESGLRSFVLANAEAGEWHAVVDASASVDQDFNILVLIASDRTASLARTEPLVYQSGSTIVQALVDSLGASLTNISWNCSITAPDSSVALFALYDDGAHNDSLASDGIYGNVFAPSGPVGFYDIVATATTGDGVSIVVNTDVELANYHDLTIIGDMRFSKNPVAAGDSVVIGAMIKNLGVDTADSLKIEFLDGSTIFAMTWVTNLAPGASQLASATWHSTAPDSHNVTVQINPFSVVDEANYTNNGVSKSLVLGQGITAVSTDQVSRPHLQLGPIAPNPFNPSTKISFSLSAAGPALIRTYDVSGRLVRTWKWQKLPAGTNLVHWDGKNQNGQSVASGVYFFRLDANRQTRTAKAVLLK